MSERGACADPTYCNSHGVTRQALLWNISKVALRSRFGTSLMTSPHPPRGTATQAQDPTWGVQVTDEAQR
jgi:hypothetical protein